MNTIDKKLVNRHFDCSAANYDNVTPTQSKMAEKIAQLVLTKSKTKEINTIIELGSGTGSLTQYLLKQYLDAKIIAIDISHPMISQAKEKLTSHENVTFINADAETIIDVPAMLPKADLIISNATIQWFTTPAETMKKYLGLLTNNGMLCFTTFGPKTFLELKTSFIKVESELSLTHRPRVLEFFTGDEWRRIFRQPEGMDVEIQVDERKQYYQSVKDFLVTIKKAGATNAYGNGNSFIGKKLIKNMISYYKQHYSDPTKSQIYATFDLIFVIVNKHQLPNDNFST